VLTGRLSVNTEHHTILFQSENKIEVFPAFRVKKVLYYDEANNINRRIISLRREFALGRRHELFEVVVQGELFLLRQTTGMIVKEGDHTITSAYFVMLNGELSSLKKFRNHIYPILCATSPATSDFVQREHLQPNIACDMVKIILFYNQWSGEQLLTRGR
jgi:hypothetical protein